MPAPLTNLEREVKLDVGLRFELPELGGILPGIVATRLPNAKLQAIYVDTADLRLMRWGVTLRHRRDVVGGAGAESGWTVKLPGDADGVALVRTELSWPGPFGPVPPEVASLVRGEARTARLEPVAKLITERHRVELRDREGRKLGEVDDDVVSVMDGRRLAARFRQVELEVSEAAPDELLDEVMRALTTAGAVAGDDRPKVIRAIGPRASLGPDVVIPPLGADATVADVVSAAIGAGVTRMILHDPGVRLGDDPEHVHQARVGTRRLRSDLRTFWRLLDPGWAGPVRAELGWLAAALGDVRDTDVLTGRLRGQIRSLPSVDAKAAAGLLRRLASQREEARVRLLAVLESDRYVALLENLVAAAAHPPLIPSEAEIASPLPDAVAPPGPTALAPPATRQELAGNGARGANGASASPPGSTGALPAPGSISTVLVAAAGAVAPALPASPAGPSPLGTVTPVSPVAAPSQLPPSELADHPAADELVPLVRRPWRHLRDAIDHLGDDPPDELLHEVRIRAKRLRYAAEAVAGVIGKPARQLAAAVAEVQAVLGDMQDAVVAEGWLRRQATSSPPSQALVAGELITLQRQEQEACRQSWEKPWKRASKKSLRRWL